MSSKIHSIHASIKIFLRELYYPEVSNDEKMIKLNEIYDQVNKLKHKYTEKKIGENELYLLEFINVVSKVDMYNIPYIKSFLEKFIYKYNTYFGIDDGSRCGNLGPLG